MMKSLGRKIACESPNLQEGSIELRNAHTNLMNIALVLCLAHVTNTMGQAGDDFEKGVADGTRDDPDVSESASSLAILRPLPISAGRHRASRSKSDI